MEDVKEETQTKEAQPKAEDSVAKEESETPVIDEAKKQADRIEAANKKQEELLSRQEALMAKQALGGKTDAGTGGKKPKEDPIEFSEKLHKGELQMDEFLNTKNE